MALIRMQHPNHGFTVVYDDNEKRALESSGWFEVSWPESPETAEEEAESTLAAHLKMSAEEGEQKAAPRRGRPSKHQTE